MSTQELDLRRTTTLSLPAGRIEIGQGDEIALQCEGGQSSRVTAPGFAGRNEYVVCWTRADEKLCVLAGLTGRPVIVADLVRCRLTHIADLARPKGQKYEKYDPGGLERLQFVEVDERRVVLVYEGGLLLLQQADGAVQWQTTHDLLQASLAEVRDGFVWFVGETGRLGFRLDEGTLSVS